MRFTALLSRLWLLGDGLVGDSDALGLHSVLPLLARTVQVFLDQDARLHAVHHRHANVEDDCLVIRLRLALDQFDGLESVLSLVDVVEVLLKSLCEGFKQELVVVGQEAIVLQGLAVILLFDRMERQRSIVQAFVGCKQLLASSVRVIPGTATALRLL